MGKPNRIIQIISVHSIRLTNPSTQPAGTLKLVIIVNFVLKRHNYNGLIWGEKFINSLEHLK